MQDQSSGTPGIPEVLSVLGAVAIAITGLVKWLQSLRDDRKAKKSSREDWLIDNAFDVVTELRKELERLRHELDEERRMNEECRRKMNAMDQEIEAANRKIRDLEYALTRKGD